MCACAPGLGSDIGMAELGEAVGVDGEAIGEAIGVGEAGGVGGSWIGRIFSPFHDFSYKFGVRVWGSEAVGDGGFGKAVDVAGTAFGEAGGVGGAIFATGRLVGRVGRVD